MQEVTGFICVILAGVGFGFLGIFGRLSFNSGMTVGQILTFRFTIAAIILFLGLTIFKREFLKLSRRQFFISMGLGVGGYAVFSTLYFKAIEGLSVSLASLLLFTFPIFVNLGSHFFLNEKMSLKQFLSLILACAGILILLWGPIFFDSLNSILFALAAAIAYSIYVMASKKFQQNVQPLSSSFYVITSAAITLAIFHQINFLSIIDLNQNQIFYVFGLAVVCTILPITLFLIGLQYLPSSRASIVVMVEPAVAVLASWVILHEELKPTQYIGMILIFIAVILNSKSKI